MEQWEQPLEGCNQGILEEDTVNDTKPTHVVMMKEEVPRASMAAREGFAAQDQSSSTFHQLQWSMQKFAVTGWLRSPPTT